MLYFYLMEEGEENESKKKRIKRKRITMEKDSLPRVGPALLAVQQVAAVTCN
jgi:hypothetical protein